MSELSTCNACGALITLQQHTCMRCGQRQGWNRQMAQPTRYPTRVPNARVNTPVPGSLPAGVVRPAMKPATRAPTPIKVATAEPTRSIIGKLLG